MNKYRNLLDIFDPEYLVTLDEIYHSHWAAKKQRRINCLKEAINYFWPQGHPSKFLHITGTNGKGSVIYYLEQGFSKYGKTGSWNGPHLFDYAERFHIDCKTADHDEIVEFYQSKIRPYIKALTVKAPAESLSFAEIGILISMFLFEKHQVAWAMMEVGAGGRYTPLMALDMTACILTNVGDDHNKSLGSEKWQRILEKSGIARPDIPFFSSAKDATAEFVKKCALARDAQFYQLDYSNIEPVRNQLLNSPEFKIRNLSLAVMIIKHFYPDYKFNYSEMKKNLQGRFHRIQPNIIVDVSHNSDKIKGFSENLILAFPRQKFKFILGLSRKRKATKVFAALKNIARSVIVTSASYAGRDPAEVALELREASFKNVSVQNNPREAYEKAKNELKPDEILILTGSAYMIEQALNPNPFIKHINRTFGRRYN
jgi:dihydrofolate synthase/folylpolyglutamate synthase